MRIQRVLCPVDFSEFSRRALHHAHAVAAWYEAALDVLHVLPDVIPPVMPSMTPVPGPTSEIIKSDREAALRDFVAESGVTRPACQAVLFGPPARTIVSYARDRRADLIVMGTHGHTGLERLLVGSTAERVVHDAECPVLTIPKGADEPGSSDRVRFTHVLVAVDHSPASLRALRLALSLAQENQAAVTLLHVVEMLSDEEARTVGHYRIAEYVQARRQDALDQLKALDLEGAESWCSVNQIVELGDAGRTILRVAGERGADLIVMGAQGRGALGRLLLGSATQTVVRRAACPLLTMRA